MKRDGVGLHQDTFYPLVTQTALLKHTLFCGIKVISVRVIQEDSGKLGNLKDQEIAWGKHLSWSSAELVVGKATVRTHAIEDAHLQPESSAIFPWSTQH